MVVANLQQARIPRVHLPVNLFAMANPARQPPRPSMPSSSTSQPGSNANKSADYVFFERTTSGFSDDAVPRAKTAQLKLEHFYKVAVDAAIERNTRCV
jgi:hypothetical protein